MEFVLSGNGGLLLLYDYGGTKKIFTLKTLIVDVISKWLIVFNIVSSELHTRRLKFILRPTSCQR